ncbi:MAG: DODA-type extradiol aromatic ring-opening family dioxygenase [Kiloniellales bacterium]
MTLPAVFVSHGAPSLPLTDSLAAAYLRGLGATLGRPKAVLCVSAHWDTTRPMLSLAERPETIYDFRGFPEALYRLTYPAPGAPDLARRAAALLAEAGETAELVPDRGLDHGAWVPLLLIYPRADIPVVQLSVQSGRGASAHLALGRALAPLRDEGVLILGSGGAVHNLRQYFGDPSARPDWALAFDDWLCRQVEAGAVEELVDYRVKAPHGRQAHPSEEHFLPLHVALGAAGEGAQGRVLHRSFDGSLSMAAFAFD